MLLWNPVCFALKTLTVLGKTGSKKLIRLINKSSIETKLCVHTYIHTHTSPNRRVFAYWTLSRGEERSVLFRVEKERTIE